ncbi:MAG: hypothetical protein WCG50_10295 [Rhodoferax sp.]|uniref:hypothetical protein n=1 Tax=Rhodoferax sp. TaxID=50421 RepID=UPI00301AC30B
MKHALFIFTGVALLCACGEKPQNLGVSTKDDSAYSGTGKSFSESGWKSGDKASWESHLKARGQNTQNEYTKTN